MALARSSQSGQQGSKGKRARRQKALVDLRLIVCSHELAPVHPFLARVHPLRDSRSDRAGSRCDAARSGGPLSSSGVAHGADGLDAGRPTREGSARATGRRNAHGPDDGRLPPLAQRDELLAGDHWRGGRGGAGRRRTRRLGARARTTGSCAPSCATSSSRRISTRLNGRQRERSRAAFISRSRAPGARPPQGAPSQPCLPVRAEGGSPMLGLLVRRVASAATPDRVTDPDEAERSVVAAPLAGSRSSPGPAARLDRPRSNRHCRGLTRAVACVVLRSGFGVHYRSPNGHRRGMLRCSRIRVLAVPGECSIGSLAPLGRTLSSRIMSSGHDEGREILGTATAFASVVGEMMHARSRSIVGFGGAGYGW